jgi:hypothetical protein
MLRPFLLLVALALCLSGCVLNPQATDTTSSGGAATSAPPRDFWLGITVTGPIRESTAAYEAQPRSMRPGRYVVEADRILRVALGPGATPESFPPPTRRLTPAEFADLYHAAQDAGLLTTDHPFAVKAMPKKPTTPDPGAAPDQTTRYIISTHAAEQRFTFVMEAAPEGSDQSRRAAAVIEWLADKAWVSEAGKK